MVGIYHLLIDGNHIVQNGSVVKHNDKKRIKESKETQPDKFRRISSAAMIFCAVMSHMEMVA